MLDYLKEKKRVCLKLGDFVSHKVIKQWNAKDGTTYRTEEELNALDREDLAYEFYESLYDNPYTDYFEGAPNLGKLIADMAVYIDRRIPQSYLKWKYSMHDHAPVQINPKKFKHGLTYQYGCNEK